mgnify:CR=1 FL=1
MGIGIGCWEWPAGLSAQVGRLDERWRFRCCQQGGHRRRALAAAGLELAWDPGWTEEAWDEDPGFGLLYRFLSPRTS